MGPEKAVGSHRDPVTVIGDETRESHGPVRFRRLGRCGERDAIRHYTEVEDFLARCLGGRRSP